MSLLKVNRLMVTGGEDIALVDNVSFTLEAGEMLGLVGESGSGKTVTCRALMRLLPGDGLRISGGEVVLDGRDILPLSEGQMSAVRGREIGMIFQNPTSHLNPVMTIGEQIAESRRLHFAANRRQAREDALALLRQVGIPDPQNRLNSYPHEFSGGMRQRAMIAVALAPEPRLLIADEPTTALDVTVQMQILRLLSDLRAELGLAVIMITHDLGVVAQTCDRIAVMYGGRLCEVGDKREVLAGPLHPYTRGLIDCQPASEGGRGRLTIIDGQPPSADHFPSGCRFHPRCRRADEACLQQPPLHYGQDRHSHAVACHHRLPTLTRQEG
ncbi:ABC transporter ATP-binding protein [Klebsiella grimontii]|mgnify:FL=1|uniref:ABC transporter ATP-binding protein n=1 Tax=Klebsiella TaxID=570 RepID=UPI000BF899A4|nr:MULTISPECIES: ABC transporter ATP-binding protein [Klebsiella]MBW5981984.1 methionine ABC transporter ATP-binding protein [Klebsiella michiganensis]CAF2806861.1 Oligopeptide transport ATP-binding protein OppD [Klebsiella oxytoca]MBW5999422.1 methionine ABC transporter ATP-binding protein [Klebsiella michiganensis]MBZ6688015.1 ABC transporter ATP-binding protein [Klebsiella grimontii]MBZ7127957.1 ABC transporter ATP-binding protein [Klebsiella grimontii]